MKLRDLTPQGDVKGGGGSCDHRPESLPASTNVALRDYFTLWLERLEVFYTRRFEDLDAKTTLALAAADKAVTKAEIATEKRFEGVNEFRATLADQAARLLPREEAASKFENIQKDITAITRDIQARRDTDMELTRGHSLDTRAWVIPMIGLGIISLLSLGIQILRLILHP